MKKDSTSVKSEMYSCPMHPDVKSDKPGKCPKCGMSLKAVEMAAGETGGKEMALKAVEALKIAKEALMAEGKYGCCNKTACDECLIAHQECSCASQLRKGESVCAQCYAGWQQGNGAVMGVKASDVKMNKHMHH
jgi:hypothetical protein